MRSARRRARYRSVFAASLRLALGGSLQEDFGGVPRSIAPLERIQVGMPLEIMFKRSLSVVQVSDQGTRPDDARQKRAEDQVRSAAGVQGGRLCRPAQDR